MSVSRVDSSPDALHARASASLGASSEPIHRTVQSALAARQIRGGTLIDVGCGRGDLRRTLGDQFDRYVGLDAVRYDGLPGDVEFHAVDLDAAEWRVPDIGADVVTAVETIEHLENPWAFVRALARLVRPGGWVLVTTPNQLSALSLATLLVKRRFSAFQDPMFPVHRTALLESDLRRVLASAGLVNIGVQFTEQGRLPLAAMHYPRAIARVFPRALSDNVAAIGQRPHA